MTIGRGIILLRKVENVLNIDTSRCVDGKPTELHITVFDATSEVLAAVQNIIECHNVGRVAIASCLYGDIFALISMIVNSSNLSELYVERCGYMNDNVISYIADKLSNNIQLTSLSLMYNRISIDGFRNIMKSCITGTTLRDLTIKLPRESPVDDAMEIVFEIIPHIKLLRQLTLSGHCYENQMDHLFNALEKNYSLEYLDIHVNNPHFSRIRQIGERNRYIRINALPALLDLAIIFAPIIRIHGCFDAYCMMWIFDCIEVVHLWLSEFKKIKIIRSVFEIYKRKIRNEEMRAVSLCL